MKQSRALISDGHGGYEVQDISVGAPGPGEIRVQIRAAGLCHTDWDSIQNWKKRFVVGHEGAGLVDAVGEGVTRVAPGDAVILNWAIPCGTCFQCLEGFTHICEKNSPVCGEGLCGHAHAGATLEAGKPVERSFHLGTLSEYTVVREQAVVRLDVPMPFSSAAIVGCGVMTGWGSAVNAARVQAGSSVAVLGCGGVGLNVIQGAALSGAVTIVAIDLNESRLAQAREFGATHGVLAQREDPGYAHMKAQVADILGGRMADYAFECTAVPALGAAPLALVRSGGTAVQVSGIEQVVPFDCELFEWDKIYINPLYGQCNPQRDFPRILSLYQSGRLKLDELVTKTYTLDSVAQGFEDMLAGRIAKGVVLLGEGG